MSEAEDDEEECNVEVAYYDPLLEGGVHIWKGLDQCLSML